jgi:hypothetical protein
VRPYYDEDGITIYHGDCREIDAWDIAGGVMVTDPPYGTANHSDWSGLHGECSVANDDDTSVRDDVLTLWGARPAIVFGSWRRSRPVAARSVLIWDKGGHAGMGDLSFPWKPNFEEIYILGTGFAGRRTTSVLSYYIHPTFNANRQHPTEKPVELMRELVGKCPPLADIVDPFMGSGTTLRAAKDLGRRAIGIELSERYCEIAAKRLGQGVLDFGGAA